MLAYKINIQDIKDQIFIPKYYDPTLKQELLDLQETHSLLPLGSLIDAGIIGAQTGHEIGKMAYGTGSIPFVRTSDLFVPLIFQTGKSKPFQSKVSLNKYINNIPAVKMFSPVTS